MNYWHYLIGIPSIVGSISWIIISFKKENEKTKRIKALSNLPNAKIEAIGNYEKKSKTKYDFSKFDSKSEIN